MLTDLTGLADQLRKVNPNVVFASEQVSSETTPFCLLQSCSLPHSNISVRVSVICNPVPNGLMLLNEIVTSDSRVLAQFRPLFVSESLSFKEKQSAIDEWVRELCVFLFAHVSMIVSCLEEASKEVVCTGNSIR